MKRMFSAAGLVWALALSQAAWAEDGKTIELFNGKDLTGWVQRGGKATYSVEEGCIVGRTAVKTPNSFLCTEKNYGDFVLEYDVWVDPSLNSGVQIRSESTPDYKNGVVHGYQVELDPSARAWSAGIYDESRRGWLFDLKNNEPARKAFKNNEWNHFKVVCQGDHIQTWLNGVPAADLHDALTPTGFIGLQVHANPKEGLIVKWKNLKLQELPAATPAPAGEPNTLTEAEVKDGWKLLWDGKTTEGWKSYKADKFPEKGWEIKDGVLTVLETGGAESMAGGDIITTKNYSNFDLRVDFKITPGANSGVKYFVDPSLNQKAGSAIGLEFQILDDDRHPDAKLGVNGNRKVGSLYDLIPATFKKVNPVGEWNTARIVSQGNHVQHYLNGVLVLQYDRGSKEYRELVAKSKYKVWPNFGELKEGPILLQDHGNRVSFRNIKIKELN